MERQRVSSGTEWESKVGCSRAVSVGDHVHVSGTTATDDDGNPVDGGTHEQAMQALSNVETALEEAGASLDDVVRTRMFVADIDKWEAIGDAHAQFFGGVRPATSMVEVSRLIDADLVVEIEAIAIVTEDE